MRDEYRREMEQFGPTQEELDRLCGMIEGGTIMKRKMWLGCRAAAALAVCAALTLTAAVAAAPTVWDALTEELGLFGPYAQVVEGASCTDQGIRLQVVNALSDDLEAKVYFTLQDLEQDRLNEYLSLSGTLTAGVAEANEGKDPSVIIGSGFPSTRYFELVSYDPDTKTALLRAAIHYSEDAQPDHKAQLSITKTNTRQVQLYGTASCESTTSAALKSLPVSSSDKVVFRPGDMVNNGYEDADALLPSKQVVLAPGQTPMPLEGSKDIQISSMGFASDGCFHIRLDFADGMRPGFWSDGALAMLCSIYSPNRGNDNDFMLYQMTLVDGGLDILFPLIKAGDLEDLKNGELRISGNYFRPGTEVEGSWSVEFDMDYYSSITLDWTGNIDGSYVREVSVSPLSVTMYSNNTGSFARAELCAVKRDSTIITAQPGTGRYANMEAVGGKGYDAFNTWKFDEPVNLADIVSLTLKDASIPVR